MFKRYRVRLYPTPKQAQLMHRTFGCVRKVYNLMRDDYKLSYEETGKGKIKTPAKYKNEYPFLKEVDSMALCNAQVNLQSAFSRFFDGIKKGKPVGYPKIKTRKNTPFRYTTNNGKACSSIRIEKSALRLPKLNFVKAKFHRYIPGTIKSVTVEMTPSGKYYASILVEQKPKITVKEEPKEEKVVGIDMSLSDLAVLSDGTKPKYPRWYRQSEKKLSKAQRQLSRKKKGSANREKQRKKVARIHEKISEQRKDFLHKLSYRIAESYDVAVVEDINLRGMAGALKLGKSVNDAGFGKFREYLEYKLEERLKTFVKADRWFASSQTCSCCGTKNPETKNLSVRVWVCPTCETTHDRDVNAALNLVNWYKTTAAVAGSNACGDHVRPDNSLATITEAGKVDGNKPIEPTVKAVGS